MASEYRERTDKLGLIGAPDIVVNRKPIYAVEALTAEKVSDTVVALDFGKATEYINLRVYPGERDVIDAHSQRLLDEMNAGRFNWDIVIMASCIFRGSRYKINGQHTAWAVIGRNKNAPVERVREIVYKTDSEVQIKALYSTFDRAKPRSNSHLTKVELVGTDAAEGVTPSTIQRVAPGFLFWKFPKSDDYKRCGPAETAAIINAQHSKLFNTVCRFYGTIDRAKLVLVNRQPVIAAMFETFDRFPHLSPGFWKDMAEGTNLTKSDARWHLNDFLMKSAVHKGTRSDKRSVTAEEMYLTCISAWQRWRKQEKVQRLTPLGARARAV